MKKLSYTLTAICLLIALGACTNMASAPNGGPSQESTPAQTSAPDSSTPAPTPTVEETPAPTEEPSIVSGPERTDLVPEGFSDEEHVSFGRCFPVDALNEVALIILTDIVVL